MMVPAVVVHDAVRCSALPARKIERRTSTETGDIANLANRKPFHAPMSGESSLIWRATLYRSRDDENMNCGGRIEASKAKRITPAGDASRPGQVVWAQFFLTKISVEQSTERDGKPTLLVFQPGRARSSSRLMTSDDAKMVPELVKVIRDATVVASHVKLPPGAFSPCFSLLHIFIVSRA